MYVCSNCGSTAIQLLMWVSINEGSVFPHELSSPYDCGDTDASYCPSCDSHNVILITEQEKMEMEMEESE